MSASPVCLLFSRALVSASPVCEPFVVVVRLTAVVLHALGEQIVFEALLILRTMCFLCVFKNILLDENLCFHHIHVDTTSDLLIRPDLTSSFFFLFPSLPHCARLDSAALETNPQPSLQSLSASGEMKPEPTS